MDKYKKLRLLVEAQIEEAKSNIKFENEERVTDKAYLREQHIIVFYFEKVLREFDDKA